MEKQLISEEYTRHPVYDGSVIHTWTFTYSDGSVESLTKMVRPS